MSKSTSENLNLENFIYLPYSEIYINPKNRFIHKHKEVLSFIGFDSETFNGTCKLLADSNGNYVYNPTFIECLDFLVNDIDDKSHRIFWNLDFDMTAILKLLPNDEKIIEKIKLFLDGFEVKFGVFTLKYLRPKFLSIKKNSQKQVYFTDLYYMYKSSLNIASKKYLNNEKIDLIDGKTLNESLEYWDKNLELIIEYCIKDCFLTSELGVFLLKKVVEQKLPIPRIITSQASFSREYFMNCRIPSIKWIPVQILDVACQTYIGGRFEMLQRGFFKKVKSIDINSAYPDTIAKLPSLKYGNWKVVNKASKKEIIGFYKVLVIIPESYISAFPIKIKKVVHFPSGTFETWITWYEYDLLKKYIIKIYKGFEYNPYEREYYPFAEKINYLYERKSYYKYVEKDETLSWINKIFMNALYGCFIERHENKENGLVFAGKLFNPVYATMITARTRWKLLKDLGKRNWKHALGFHTDSIILDKIPLRLRLKVGKKMGKWSIEKKGVAILLLSGIYQIGSHVRNRGFSTKKQDTIKESSVGKTLSWKKLLEKNYLIDTIPFDKLRVIKSKGNLVSHNNLDRANSFVIGHKELNINSDHKRNWERPFTCCQDVLDNIITSKTLKYKYIRDDNLGM